MGETKTWPEEGKVGSVRRASARGCVETGEDYEMSQMRKDQGQDLLQEGHGRRGVSLGQVAEFGEERAQPRSQAELTGV